MRSNHRILIHRDAPKQMFHELRVRAARIGWKPKQFHGHGVKIDGPKMKVFLYEVCGSDDHPRRRIVTAVPPLDLRRFIVTAPVIGLPTKRKPCRRSTQTRACRR